MTPRRSVGRRRRARCAPHARGAARGDGRGRRARWVAAAARVARPAVRLRPRSCPRGALGAELESGGPSAGLPVRRVLAAPAAVFAHLEPVGRVPLRLRAHVVTPLALVAGEGDLVSYSGCHFFVSLEEFARRDKGPTRAASQCSGQRRPLEAAARPYLVLPISLSSRADIRSSRACASPELMRPAATASSSRALNGAWSAALSPAAVFPCPVATSASDFPFNSAASAFGFMPMYAAAAASSRALALGRAASFTSTTRLTTVCTRATARCSRVDVSRPAVTAASNFA